MVPGENECVADCNAIDSSGKYVAEGDGILVPENEPEIWHTAWCGCGEGYFFYNLDCFDCWNLDPFAANCRFDD